MFACQAGGHTAAEGRAGLVTSRQSQGYLEGSTVCTQAHQHRLPKGMQHEEGATRLWSTLALHASFLPLPSSSFEIQVKLKITRLGLVVIHVGQCPTTIASRTAKSRRTTRYTMLFGSASTHPMPRHGKQSTKELGRKTHLVVLQKKPAPGTRSHEGGCSARQVASRHRLQISTTRGSFQETNRSGTTATHRHPPPPLRRCRRCHSRPASPGLCKY